MTDRDNNNNNKRGSVIFVDDEPRVLEGLKRMLRAESRSYDFAFAAGGNEALDLMQKNKFDLVVTDMKMPGMNGVQLLGEVKRYYPDTIRIILSGEIELEMRMRSVNISHQFLTKPCDSMTLKSAITRTCEISRMFNSVPLKRALTAMNTLPSLPSIYMEIIRELQSPDSSLKRIGEIIASDMAMASKILQLVNSAYFSLPRQISSPEQAAILLGVDTIKSLVLATGIFNKFESETIPEKFISSLWTHNLMTGNIARKIAENESQDQNTIDQSFIAGLLHDSGKLILASGFPEQYAQIITQNSEEKTPIWEIEKAVLGISHQEAGSYLMGLWGLPFPVIEAIACHHSPALYEDDRFSPLTAVYIANILEHSDLESGSQPELNTEYLKRLNINTDPEYWIETRKNIRAGAVKC